MPATQLKSVLIVSQGHPPLGRYLADAFKTRGIDAVVFCTDQNTWFDKWVIHPVNKQLHNLRILPKGKNVWVNHPWAHRNHLNSKFRKLFQHVRPDMVLAIRGATYCDQSIKEANVIKFGWWVEPANRANEIQSELPVFDWYYSMNEESLAAFNSWGFEACSYMPHMFSETEFFPIEGVNKDIDLVFCGKWNPRRQEFLDAAMEVTSSIVLYGKDWLKKNWRNPKYWRAWKGRLVQGQALNQLYNRAKVVLNVTQWEPGADGRASGMNMRFFEVPATKSLFMTDRVDEATSVFEPDRDYIDFGDIDEFKERLHQLLLDFPRRRVIAEHGYQTVCRSQASYQRMALDIINRYRKVQAGERHDFG